MGAYDQTFAAERPFRAAFDNSPIGMALVAPDGRFLQVNRTLSRFLGRSREALLRMRLQDVTHPADLERDREALRRLAAGETPSHQTEMRYVHADGTVMTAALHVDAIAGEHGRPECFVGQLKDITETRRAEEEADRYREQLEFAQELSALGSFTFDPAEAQWTWSAGLYRLSGRDPRSPEPSHADIFGSILHPDDRDRVLAGMTHAIETGGSLEMRYRVIRAGVVSQVAGELCRALRSTDIPARIGGDEFAVLLPEAGEAEGLTVAQKLVDAVATLTLPVGDGSVTRVTASVGITAFGPGSAVTTDDLIAEADIAVHEAKSAGRSTVRAFPVEQQRDERITQVRARWVERLRDAIEHERFRLVAQPIADICSTSGPRAELLLRYADDDGELVGPANFLYLAERYDLIHEIDRWVLAQAIGLLHRSHRAGRPIGLSVNLSARTLADPALADEIAALLADQPVAPGSLTIEVTETAAITNLARAHDFAERLHEHGCRLALDDFGAGFASFYYLKHLDFDEIKIDGEFVRHLLGSRVDRLVVEAVVGIAKGLGATTVAEFVGDDETVELLRSMGVDHGQGFHLGEPVPVQELVGRPSPFGRRWVRTAPPAGHGRPPDAGPGQSTGGGGAGSGGAATAGAPAR